MKKQIEMLKIAHTKDNLELKFSSNNLNLEADELN